MDSIFAQVYKHNEMENFYTAFYLMLMEASPHSHSHTPDFIKMPIMKIGF